MILKLDRIALDDVGLEPQRLAEAILGQIQYERGRVPIVGIAGALGITEIREEKLTNLEGCLITTAERRSGAILLNSNSPRRRRNFTLGHEIGHYLNAYHEDAGETRFSCSAADLRALSIAKGDRSRRHEVEANRFAIEILAPCVRCKAMIGDEPNIGRIIALATEFDISREAAARRYVELHYEPLAVVFAKGGRVTYSARSKNCPPLVVRKGDAVPLLTKRRSAGALIDRDAADISLWLARDDGEVMVESLFQENDHSMTLLRMLLREEDEPDIEDSFDRFARVNERG